METSRVPRMLHVLRRSSKCLELQSSLAYGILPDKSVIMLSILFTIEALKVSLQGFKIFLEVSDKVTLILKRPEFFLSKDILMTMDLGALVVYDITDVDSFEKVQTWVKELRKYLPKTTPILIAGNKCDMESKRQISLDKAEE